MSAEIDRLKSLLQETNRLIDGSREKQVKFAQDVVQPNLTLNQVTSLSRSYGRVVAKANSDVEDKLKQVDEAIDEVAKVTDRLEVRLEEAEREQNRLAEVADDLRVSRDEAVREQNRLIGVNDQLEARLGDAMLRIDELTLVVEDKPKPIQPVTLADQFRLVIEKVSESGMSKPEGGAAVVLKSMDVEVKGLITIKGEETHVLMPTPGQVIDPGQLSTIRMTFAKVPVLSSAEPPPNP